MKKILVSLFILCMFLLVGCVPKYTLVENKRVDIAKTYSVDPQINWNQMVFPEGNQVFWTVNGSNLDRLLFLSHVKDGKPLFQDQKKDKYPSYKKGMNIIEISELYSDTIKISGAAQLEILNLEARGFGSFEGFAFEAKKVAETGLTYRELVAGAVIKDELFIIAYTAVEMEYFPRYVEHVKRLLGSIKEL
jgi:hypothetical protein